MSEYKIIGGMLHIGGTRVSFKESPNVGGACRPTLIVFHDTASGLDEKSPINWLTNPAAKASAHFVVARDGSITQLVSTDRTAYHAGKSVYDGKHVNNSVNTFSIGIEIVNPGVMTIAKGGKAYYGDGKGASWDIKKYGIAKAKPLPASLDRAEAYWMPYTKEQIDAVIAIGRAVKEAYPAVSDGVAHWYVSPGRKVDTNPLFPLDGVRNDIFNGGTSTKQYKDPVQPDPEVDPNANVKAPEEPVPVAPVVEKPTPAPATKKVSYDVGLVTRELNLRNWPDSPNILAVIAVGSRIDIERTSTSQVTGSIWYKVRVKAENLLYHVGKEKYLEGFVHSAYIQRVL